MSLRQTPLNLHWGVHLTHQSLFLRCLKKTCCFCFEIHHSRASRRPNPLLSQGAAPHRPSDLNCADHEPCRTWCMYYDHETCMYKDHSTSMYQNHSTSMYYDQGTCLYYDHSTAMYSDHRTCMYCDHSTCMYYDHSTCTYYDQNYHRDHLGMI